MKIRNRVVSLAGVIALGLGLGVGALVSAAPASAHTEHYVTAVWQMRTLPPNDTTATWPQDLVSQSAQDHQTLDVTVPSTCGTAYQVDSYVKDKLPRHGLPSVLHSGDDTSWLAPGGWGTAYKVIINPPCLLKDAAGDFTVGGATCDAPGTTVTLTGVKNATPAQPVIDNGKVSITFTADKGHAFPSGDTTLTVVHDDQPQLTGDQCAGPQPPNDVQHHTSTSQDCASLVVTTVVQSRTRSYSLVNGAWVPGAWSAWTTDSTSTAPATSAQCPPLATCPSTSPGFQITDQTPTTDADTRSGGHIEYTADSVHIWTDSNTSNDKVSNYYALSIPLADAGSPVMDQINNSGGEAGLQLGIDRDGNGTWDGYLVSESAYPAGEWWTNKIGFGVPAGMGYPSYGTLAQYVAANPNAKIVSFGYSLGSGVHGDDTINSITVGCKVYTFGHSIAHVSPVAPTVTAGTCDTTTGVDSPYKVNLPADTNEISYSAKGLVVTATLAPGFVEFSPIPAGWTSVANGVLTYTLTISQPDCHKVVTTPPTTSTPAPVTKTVTKLVAPVAQPHPLASTGVPTMKLLAAAIVIALAGLVSLLLGIYRPRRR